MSRRVTRGFSPERLRALRVNAGLSQGDLARLADAGRTTLYQWETGAASPQVDVLARVAAALKVHIAELIVIPDDEVFPGDLRVRCGLTQPQLGQATGISTSMIGAIERGEVKLGDLAAEALASALGVTAEAFAAAHARARQRPAGSPA